MLCEHTHEEQQLWCRIKERIQDGINESNSMSHIECSEVDGQLTLWRRKPDLREIVLSFSSPSPVMYIHFQQENTSSSIRSLQVDGGHLIDSATNAPLEIDDLVANLFKFLG